MSKIEFLVGYYEWNVYLNDELYYSFGYFLGDEIYDTEWQNIPECKRLVYVVESAIDGMLCDVKENTNINILTENEQAELKTQMINVLANHYKIQI